MINKLFVSIFLVISIATLAIAIIFGEGQSRDYWYTVAWILFLFFLNWLTSIAIVEPKKRGTPGNWVGILPFISGLTVILSLSSLGLVALWWASVTTTNILFAGQIVMFTLWLVICLIAIIARYFAAYGAESEFTKEDFLKTTKNLQLIRDSEQDLILLKEIYDYVAYHMPHPSKLDTISLAKAMKLLESEDRNPPSYNDIERALKIIKSA